MDVGKIRIIRRPKRSVKIPVVFTQDEVRKVLNHLQGRELLMAKIMYGAGLPLMESMRLRVKDVDFGYKQILVRDGKGLKDRRTMLPESLISNLKNQIEKRKRIQDSRDQVSEYIYSINLEPQPFGSFVLSLISC